MKRTMKYHYVSLVGLLALGLLAASGCPDNNNEGGGSFSEAIDDMVASLQACHLMTEGRFFFPEPNFSDEKEERYNTCIYECISKASCAELEVYICTDEDETLTSRCMQQCAPVFTCNDGGTVSDFVVCDGEEDCADGSDERDCLEFECDDGGTVPIEYQCDGEQDCDDGSDETGCAVFQCDDGGTVPIAYQCDGDPDCDDGSDERANCPTFKCANGESISAWGECDGQQDCSDGSDEEGCAEITCPE